MTRLRPNNVEQRTTLHWLAVMFLWLCDRDYKGCMYYSATGCYSRIRKHRHESVQNCNLICWFLWVGCLTVMELPMSGIGALRGMLGPKRARQGEGA
jgi:hypothetical protein